MAPPNPSPDAPLLLYDGECGLCSRAVQFILRRDARQRMLFASLQSETGREVLSEAGLDPSDLTTMILRTGPGALLVRSDAALTAAAELRVPWRWASGLRWIPRPIRDAVYRVIARFRHRIFPAPAACMLPGPEDGHRFID